MFVGLRVSSRAEVSGATQHGLLIGFQVPSSSQNVAGARTRTHHCQGVMIPWAYKGGNRASSVASKFSRNHLSVAMGLLPSFSVCFAVGVRGMHGMC